MPVPVSRPSVDEVRNHMGLRSSEEVRGQCDAVGYATKRDAMEKVWELSAQGPMPESFGTIVEPGVLGVIGPHDDHVYSARTCRQIFPLVTAKVVVVVGVFHRAGRFAARDQLYFDTYRAWSSPDGEIAVSPLRDELIAQLPAGIAVQDAAAHDSEHSIEAITHFLKHERPDIEIVPVMVPGASFDRLREMASELAEALAASMKSREWQLGRDVSIVISADGTHYGEDFKFTPFGQGGVTTFTKAVDADRKLINETLCGPFETQKARDFYDADISWCGHYSVPLGMMLIGETAQRLGLKTPRGVPVALGVSVDTAELAVRQFGVGPTAPANLYHFVTHPAVAFVADS